MRTLPLLALATLTSAFSPTAFAGKPQQARAPLVRPEATPPDDDAKGRMDMRSHKNGQDRFGVKVSNVDSALALEAFLEDAVGAGTFTSIGLLTADDADSAGLKFDQKSGALPFDVPDVEDLAGRELQVQVAATVYLRGMVPEFPTKGNSKGGAWKTGRANLTRPDTPPDDDAKGTVEVRNKAKENRDRFSVKVERVPASTVTFSLFLDDGLGTLTDVGPLTPSPGDPDAAKFRLDTKSGAPLPFDLFDVEDLIGRPLEVRGDDTFTYLTGEVPEFETGKKKDKAKANLNGSGGKGELRLDSHSRAPYQKLELKVDTDLPNDTVDLFMEDPADNVLKLVAQMATDGNGKGRYRVNTKSGAPLPFFLPFLEDLEGMAVEVRDSGSTVLMSGTVPGL